MKKLYLLTGAAMAVFALSGCASRVTNVLEHNSAQPHEHVQLFSLITEDKWGSAMDELFSCAHENDTAAAIVAGSAIDAAKIDTLKNALTEHGISEDAVAVIPAREPQSLSVALYPAKDKFASLDEHWFSSAAVSPDFGSATHYNLYAAAADKSHLDKPAAIGGQNPMAAIGPVERYQSGQVRELRDVSISPGSSSSGSSSGSGS